LAVVAMAGLFEGVTLGLEGTLLENNFSEFL